MPTEREKLQHILYQFEQNCHRHRIDALSEGQLTSKLATENNQAAEAIMESVNKHRPINGGKSLSKRENRISSMSESKPTVPGDGELRKRIADILSDAHRHQHWACMPECEDHKEGSSPINQMMQLFASHSAAARHEIRRQVAADIFNLAHKYAQEDKTMKGAEELRAYHYFNAIHKIGEFNGR